jgi:hypothetical protein
MIACTRQTNLGQQWLQLRKERGKVACLEKARSIKTVCDAESQGKTCMVKAILPEPQFAAAYDRSNIAERLTRYPGRKEDGALKSSLIEPLVRAIRESAHPAHPLYGGASERTRHLNTSHLPTRVITGCPAAGDGAIRRPVWARNRHSTQRLGVTSETAAGQPADGCRNKHGATRVNVRPIGGRAIATVIRQSVAEAC